MRATVCAGAGTGDYQQGSNAYTGVDGFQSVPADWSITGPKTTSWFAAMAGQAVPDGAAPCDVGPPPPG